MAKKLKVIDTTTILQDAQNGITRLTRTYELNGEKFRIHYENSNGFPLGFNYKKCLSQYSRASAKWNNLEDISSLPIGPSPSYYNLEASKLHMEEFFRQMEKRLVSVYSSRTEPGVLRKRLGEKGKSTPFSPL